MEDKNGKIVPQKNSQALAKAIASIMHARNFDSLREYSVKIGALKFQKERAENKSNDETACQVH